MLATLPLAALLGRKRLAPPTAQKREHYSKENFMQMSKTSLSVKTDIKAGLYINPVVGMILVILTEIGRALS